MDTVLEEIETQEVDSNKLIETETEEEEDLPMSWINIDIDGDLVGETADFEINNNGKETYL